MKQVYILPWNLRTSTLGSAVSFISSSAFCLPLLFGSIVSISYWPFGLHFPVPLFMQHVTRDKTVTYSNISPMQ